MKKYHDPQDRYVFTGSDFARKLLDALDLKDIGVESTEMGITMTQYLKLYDSLKTR